MEMTDRGYTKVALDPPCRCALCRKLFKAGDEYGHVMAVFNGAVPVVSGDMCSKCLDAADEINPADVATRAPAESGAAEMPPMTTPIKAHAHVAVRRMTLTADDAKRLGYPEGTGYVDRLDFDTTGSVEGIAKLNVAERDRINPGYAALCPMVRIIEVEIREVV